MLQRPAENRDAFRAIFPGIADEDIPDAHERLRRLVRLAIEIFLAAPEPVLTASQERSSVEGGAVDPSTFTNTG